MSAVSAGNPGAGAAWLVTNRWLAWDKFEQQFAELQRAAARTGMALERVSTDYAGAHLDGPLPRLALIMDKDVAAAAQLEARGVRCVNSARAIALCDNKAYTHAVLDSCGIAHAPTVTAPLVYRPLSEAEWEGSAFVGGVDKQLGYPVVLKHAVGSWGNGVYLAHSRAELVRMLAEAGTRPLIAEAFIAESAGQDARIYLVGDTPVAAMRRRGAEGDFRSNITGGGSAEPWEPPPVYIAAARRAMAALGLDIGSVDFLNPGAAEPLVGEVNSNAQFVTLAQTTGVDVAGYVAEYLRGLARR